ncbi:MAG TPA: NrsF family protein, partial [Rhizomicrobium sp.]|nr:NrsF family protein [Rhizomicrobium sp.]
AIVAVSLPVLAGAFWSLRRMAPTRLTEAGAAVGLFAGSAGAFVYAFYCTESAAPFVALWYSTGIGLSVMLGALIGRTALRW